MLPLQVKVTIDINLSEYETKINECHERQAKRVLSKKQCEYCSMKPTSCAGCPVYEYNK